MLSIKINKLSIFTLLILLVFNNYIFAAKNNEDKNKLNITQGTLIIKQGKKETGVKTYIMNDIKKGTIRNFKIKEDNYIKEKNQPLRDDYILDNKVIKYKTGELLTIKCLYNTPLILEFYDSFKNPIKFKYFSMNSPYFTIKEDKNEPNRLFITPTQKYRNGILTLGTNVDDFPIQIKFQENSAGTKYSSFIKIITDKSVQNLTLPVEERFKEALFSEEIKLNNFKNYPQVDYEVWSIQKGKMVFKKDVMKIYYIETLKKGNYLVLLNRNYKILGYDNLMFSKYDSKYNIYLLDFNTNVFTIISKNVYKSSKDREKLRIIIRN